MCIRDRIGLDNFKRTLSDARVWNAFKNTFYYVIISVPVQLLVALILAYWLYKPTFFNKLCRSVFYVPVLCSFTAIGIQMCIRDRDVVVPQLMPIIEKLDELARTRTGNESLAIIDRDGRVHMAHMDIHFTHSTNCLLYTSRCV